MLFLADEISNELKQIVEFLNEQMDPAEVLALEIKQYVGENQSTLIPRLYGQTTKAQMKKDPSRIRKQWDEPSFLSELLRREGQAAVDVAKSILIWAKSNNLWLWFGKGSRSGSCYPMFTYKEYEFYTFAMWTYGSIEFQFQYIREHPIFDNIQKRKKILDKLNTIPGVSIPKDGVERRPSIYFSDLETESSLNLFFSIWEEYLNEIRENYKV